MARVGNYTCQSFLYYELFCIISFLQCLYDIAHTYPNWIAAAGSLSAPNDKVGAGDQRHNINDSMFLLFNK